MIRISINDSEGEEENMKETESRLKTHHKFIDFLYWNLVVSVPFITACIAILRHSALWLTLYIVACILLVLVLCRFFCTHCPHYLQNGKTVSCMFYWKIPKFFKETPGPLSLLEKVVSLFTLFIIILLPLYWLLLEPGLMVIYFLSAAVVATTIRRYECRRCIYTQCPSNCVPEE